MTFNRQIARLPLANMELDHTDHTDHTDQEPVFPETTSTVEHSNQDQYASQKYWNV